MFMSDTSALFAAQFAATSDGAWSALPHAPVVDDSRAATSWRTVARRVVGQVLPQRKQRGQADSPCATPVLG